MPKPVKARARAASGLARSPAPAPRSHENRADAPNRHDQQVVPWPARHPLLSDRRVVDSDDHVPDGQIRGELREPRARGQGEPQSGQKEQYEKDNARDRRPCFLVRDQGAHSQTESGERGRADDQDDDESGEVVREGDAVPEPPDQQYEYLGRCTTTAAIIAQVGSGERRTRFKSPISRLTTRLMVNMLKQAAITP